MKKFNDLQFEPKYKSVNLPEEYRSSIIARMQFNNGYGVSVVRGFGTYGGDQGLYELAVLKNDELCYDTHITSDVMGYLTEQEVTDLMKEVQLLK